MEDVKEYELLLEDHVGQDPQNIFLNILAGDEQAVGQFEHH